MAATAIGRTVGVAKAARLVAVRILNCQGSGKISDTVAALDWVAQRARRPAVVRPLPGTLAAAAAAVADPACASTRAHAGGGRGSHCT